ncbi:peptidase domain-containing ABC transporter [Photorhabdus caribbeanensis]|uniref:peptidase domain-containing ABC transporter n=1 Tax=Photorhabdus caribbeanensis TaxID=1004165 RepID=UPI001BD650D8|nr:peptidase domain-containing ABC transporter [Photorhabdus caribbeanensis]
MIKNTFRHIIKNLNVSSKKRVPQILQTESAECGLACLSMICAFYGKNIDLFSLRQRFNISPRGATLRGIAEIAAQLDMMTRPLSLDIDELSSLKTPCILHWNFNHFVVLVGIKTNRFIIHDPAQGHRIISLAEISRHFTGVAMEVWPGNDFKVQTVRKRVNLRKLIRGVQGIQSSLVKIFCLSLIIESINLLMPVSTQLVMDHVIPSEDNGLLTLICIGLLFFILLRAVVSMGRAWSLLVMGTLIDIQWKSGLFSHLMRLPLDYFEKRKLGDIQSRFGSLEVLRSTFTTNVVGVIMDSIMVTGVLIMMILYGGYLTWFVIGFTALYVIIRLSTYTYYRQLSEEVLVRDARANSYFMETLYGISTVKTQGMAELRGNNWLNLIIDKANSSIKLTKMDMLFGGLNTFISACDQVIILWLGANLIIDNQMTIGMFVAFGTFRSQFSERIASLTGMLLQLRMLNMHNERISDIALSRKEKRKPEVPYVSMMQPVSLEIKGLSYRYDRQSYPVFTDLNISIAPGESVAITGPSGVGKTTLMKVLCGLFEPSSGKVLVDGSDIFSLGINNYQRMISCVMQEDKLFSGSIKENICGFQSVTDEEWLIECTKASYIHNDIIKMPMGFETIIGELGEGLSGGQRQRIFIARALYRRPRILFMDEATSHLDKESEFFVNQAISKMNITRVIIAHRDSTINSADKVIRL